MVYSQQVAESYEPFPSGVTLAVLGPPCFMTADKQVPIRGHSKSEGFLICLALFHHDAAPRDQLLEQLWPDQGADLAIQTLNSVTSELNKLGRKHFDRQSIILYEQGYYRFNSEAGVGTDIEYFETHARTGQRLLTCGEAESGLAYCERALACYRGDLCGDGSLQALIARERLRVVLLDLLAALANYHYAKGDPKSALDFLNRLLARDPCREDAHRQAMRCYAHLGLRVQALRQYQLCQQALAVEFSATPEAATTALFEQIRMNPASVS